MLQMMMPAASLGFLWFIYTPLELLFGNEVDLSYNMYTLLGYMLPVFLLFTAALTALLALVRKKSVKAYRVCQGTLLGVLLASYLQGTFFSANLPPLDGRVIRWADYSGGRISSLLLWAAVFAVLFLALWKLAPGKREKAIALISAVFMLMLAIAITITCVAVGGYHRQNGIMQSDTYLFDMSEDENLVIVLLDAVDGARFKEVMEQHPEYAEMLEDFTSYDNVMACYPFTSRSVPFMLTGQWFENEQPFRDYCIEALPSSPLFTRLKEEGYRMGFYDPSFSFVLSLEEMFENISRAPFFRSPLRFILLQMKMSGYRSLPFDCKRFCVVTPAEISNATVRSNGIEGYYTWENEPFLDRLQEKEVTLSDRKCFRYIYLYGAHTPFLYPAEAECFEDYSYESSVEECVSIMDAYLRKLKDAGVYDSTAVVFLADHGYVDDDLTEGKQNPFLLIKGRGEKHPFTVNSAPISHDDLQEAFSRLIDGEESASVFSCQEGDERERRYLFFEYGEDEVMEEMVQTGFADDETTLLPTGREFILGES